MSWLRRLHPVLFAVFPVLGVAADNSGRYQPAAAVVLSLVMAAGAAVTFAIAYALLRVIGRRAHSGGRGYGADTAALATLAVVGLFYAGVPVDYMLGNPRRGTAILLVGLAAAAIAAGPGRRRGWLRRLPHAAVASRVLTLAGTILVAFQVFQLVLQWRATTEAIEYAARSTRLMRPVRLRDAAGVRAAGVAGRLPDMYVVVLDEYASSATLRRWWGIDNSAFEDSLRAMGFTIPRGLRSNYPHTIMSVSSFLNFQHTSALAGIMGTDSRDYGPAAHLIEENRAARFLKGLGYRFVFFASSWYGPTRTNRLADEVVQPGGWSRSIAAAIQRSELAVELSAWTQLRFARAYLPGQREVRTRDALYTLARLRTIAPTERPTFALAHVLMPHGPYTADAQCRPVRRDQPLYWGAEPGASEALAAELQCLNRKLLATVRAILRRSSTPPVIVLQGDHGTLASRPFDTDAPGPEQVAERLLPFGAYYLPRGGAAAIPDSVTSVNVLRYVFSYYFGADLPPIADELYFSHWGTPYRLIRVDNDFRPMRGRGPDTRVR